jgi:hypothetical protein
MNACFTLENQQLALENQLLAISTWPLDKPELRRAELISLNPEPQGLKPKDFICRSGTAKAMP